MSCDCLGRTRTCMLKLMRIAPVQVMHLRHLAQQHRVRHLMTCGFYAWLEQTLQQADVLNTWQEEGNAPQHQQSQAVHVAKYALYAYASTIASCCLPCVHIILCHA